MPQQATAAGIDGSHPQIPNRQSKQKSLALMLHFDRISIPNLRPPPQHQKHEFLETKLQQPGKKGSSSSWPQSQKAAWQIVLKNDWFALLQLEQTQNIPELQMMHSLALMNVKHRAISKPTWKQQQAVMYSRSLYGRSFCEHIDVKGPIYQCAILPETVSELLDHPTPLVY
uniref:Uncharacterized protein n=1 Tax=Lotharella globosa TaxID=91324 RepID=A0A6V3K2P6_9EUKA